jgi:glycosyltransferase involved in cell wall biosynthesis
VVLHSVYEHQDKAICTSAIKEIIVHTEAGKDCLERLGRRGGVTVIPHGCVDLGDVSELYNKYEVPYPLMQFGFGFSYKGVEVALDALAILKDRPDRKYEEIFFTYLCSEAPHSRNIIDRYHDALSSRIRSLGLSENVVILRGYRSEEDLFRHLRVNRLAIFPYRSDPENVVYGASGAVRLALANRVPTIASSSPMFADLEGVVPRPDDAAGLAREIDRVFSDGEHRRQLIARSADFVARTSWKEAAALYADMMRRIIGTGGARRLIRVS